MSDQTNDPAQLAAWGDVAMPAEADVREARFARGRRLRLRPGRQRVDAAPNQPSANHNPPEDATRPVSRTVLNYEPLPFGPSNEAMEDGTSPAPRGYTGGAMGRYVAGLSPSFRAAAEGQPPLGGTALYTPAEAAATFSGNAGRGAEAPLPLAAPAPDDAHPEEDSATTSAPPV